MGTITFAPKNKFTPLQAADRLAYEIFKAHSEPHISRETWTMLIDAKPTRCFGRYLDANAIMKITNGIE